MSTSDPGHEPLFEQASRDVLDYLHAHVPLAFWAVTRVENGRQTYLTVQDSSYGLSAGGSHPWDASFCIHMASGAAPHIAPDAQAAAAQLLPRGRGRPGPAHPRRARRGGGLRLGRGGRSHAGR